MRKQLIKNNWDFTLYDDNGVKILKVAFYRSYFDFTRDFLLQGDELDYDFEQLKVLAEDIRKNYENYKDREVVD